MFVQKGKYKGKRDFVNIQNSKSFLYFIVKIACYKNELEKNNKERGKCMAEVINKSVTERNTSVAYILSRLKQSLREYKGRAWATALFAVGEVVMEGAIPFIAAKLIDQIKAGADLNTVARYGVVLIAFAFGGLLFGTAAGITGSDSSCGFAKNLRQDMFENIQKFSFANIDRFSTPSLVTRLTTDVNYVQQSFLMTLVMAIRAPVMFVFALIMAYVMAGKMAFVFLAVGPFLGITLFFIFRAAIPVFHRVFKRYDKLNERIEENIHGIREVKSYVREDYEIKKFKKATHELYSDFRLADCIISLVNPAMNLAVNIVFVVVIYFGSYVIISSQAQAMDVGQFSALITYGFMILVSLMMFSWVFAALTMAKESALRICEVLEETSTIKNPENPIMKVESGELVFNQVSFKYDEAAPEYVLKDVNLSIPSGSSVGIIGATGSAKTSLAQLTARLYDVTEGSVFVGGQDVRSYDLDVLRKAVSLVEQKNTLFSGTIAENLRWGNGNASDEELIEACKIACAHDFIMQFPEGYETKITQGGSNVSGGQKQRLCIARALLRRPEILIFDDSTSAVDTKTDAHIRAGLMNSLPDMTKIIIAQRIDSVKDADMIVVMDRGRIAQVGTHDQLLETSSIYRETYESQMGAKVEEEEL